MTDVITWPEDFSQRYRELGYWQGQTLGGMLRERAAIHGDNTAIVCGVRRWRYTELNARADALAAGFLRLGLRSGDRVVVQLPNIAEFFSVIFALFRLGAWPVFALPAHRRAELDHFCGFSEARAYITIDSETGFDFRMLARQLQSAHPTLEHVVVVGDAQEFISLDSLHDQPIVLPEPRASEVAFLQLSGGSTGLSKLIPRTHDDYFYSVRASAEICGLSGRSVYLCLLPAAHNFPLSSPGTLGILHAGGTVVLARRPNPEDTFPLIEREGVTMTAMVPPLALVWLDAQQQRHADLSSLEVLQVGGAKLAEEVARRITAEFGCTLQQVFGMAEGLVNYTRLDDAFELVVSTQGRPISPHDEVLIVDDDDKPVAPGETGHLLTRGPYTIRGYYRASTHNTRAFTGDGYYRTGDIARQLPSGHLIVEGRAKDQINRGGEKVAAEEVENHLLAHPQVADVALVAMPDAYLGEKSCAFVIPRETLPRAAELNRFLRERGLAQFKIPDRIEFVDRFPKTAVGKVDKRALREAIAQLTLV
ncbi:(2,3-dihydroxybenzoyl)adenylate synthase [Chitiniphilus eburneus]|uniref:(2,3-dihydroxybenzoyl)adenylate synthase n=1 Tax=Chitiniphilus eburneus TaxID=2571148 RepID=UPI0035CFF75B